MAYFGKAKLGKELYANAQDYEETEIAKVTNSVDSYVDADRGTVTISQEEYKILKNKNSYSNIEKEIGTWVDGSKLYQITFTGVAPTTSGSYDSSGQLLVGTITSDATRIIDYSGFFNYAGAGEYYPLSGNKLTNSTGSVGGNIIDRNVYFVNKDSTKHPYQYQITVQYIK